MTRPAAALHRSYLYCPASSERLLAKVLGRGADVVVLDLEDGVAPAEKDAARDRLAAFLDGLAAPDGGRDPSRPALQVRINRDGDGWRAEDLAVAAHPAVHAVTLPKAEDPARVAEVAAALDGTAVGLHVTIESARGVEAAEALARCPRVLRFGLGAADLAADLGLHATADHPAFDHVRGRLVVASRAAGIAPPVDAVHLAVDDEAGLRSAAARARAFGFFGKSVVHPAQVAVVHEVFTPTADEVAHARRVVAAAEAAEDDGLGAVLLDGDLVDAPVVARAHALLALVRPEDA